MIHSLWPLFFAGSGLEHSPCDTPVGCRCHQFKNWRLPQSLPLRKQRKSKVYCPQQKCCCDQNNFLIIVSFLLVDRVAPNGYTAGATGGAGVEGQIESTGDHFFCCVSGKCLQKNDFIAIHRAGNVSEQNQIIWLQL